MSVMPTVKKGRWVSHKEHFRRVLKRNEGVAVDALEDCDDSSWKIRNAFLTDTKYIPSGLTIACDEFKEALGISESTGPLFAGSRGKPDVVVLRKNEGPSGSWVFEVNRDWSPTKNAFDMVWGTNSLILSASSIVRLLKQKMASSVIWIDAGLEATPSESPTEMHKILFESATGYEHQWLRWITRAQLQQQHSPLIAEENIETNSLHWIQNSEEILRRLESPDTKATDQITAVLFAETTAFSAEEKPRMLNALFKFTNSNRFSTDEKTVVAVGSAVRKFAMNMPASMLDQYAQLFVPSATESISCRIELELAKGASWRLAKLPTAECASAKQLGCRLAELASDYLVPRLILQENYASIALAATVGVILMNGESQDALLKRVQTLRAGQHDMNWFRELLADRLMEIAGKQGAIDNARADRLRVMARELDGSVHC